MVKVLKNWPILMLIAVWIVCFINWRFVADTNTQELGAGFLFFYVLSPACILIASIWYGALTKNVLKWLLVIVFGAFQMFVVLSSTGDWDIKFYWPMAFIGIVPAIIGFVIGGKIGKTREAMKEARAEKKAAKAAAEAAPAASETEGNTEEL